MWRGTFGGDVWDVWLVVPRGCCARRVWWRLCVEGRVAHVLKVARVCGCIARCAVLCGML